jgi:demethylmenaquinone methyltransferase/2-methoxy-6-polyprenyl-1,4-benzoquinol methylase
VTGRESDTTRGVISERNAHARFLFEGVAHSYARPAEILSFGQYRRWRNYAVRSLPIAGRGLVLDVATGTGLVARALVRRRDARVVGLDLTQAMLRRARGPGILVVSGRAEQLPFADASFDGVVFTYLLRYVDDPATTLAELARVLRPGGAMASVEFGLPRRGPVRACWNIYALHVFPLVAGLFGRGWREIGRFLGPSIVGFNERWSAPALEDLWRGAGMHDVITRRLTFGAGVVTVGTKDSP